MKSLLLTLIIFVSSAQLFLAQAQEVVSPSPTDEVAAAILQKQRLDEEIRLLNETYRGQLTEYRTAEKAFQIARDQYQQLQTLASINEVTEAARQVMKLRGQVLLTYFELLRVRLIAAEGIELSLKEPLLPKIEQRKNWLQQEQQLIAAANDREQFNTLADAFSEQLPPLQATSQEAITLLTVGKLQDVFDRLALIGEDLTKTEASNSALVDSRAMRETKRATEEVRVSFQTIWDELRRNIQNDNISNFYTNLSKTLNPVYSNLNKLAAFLAELPRSVGQNLATTKIKLNLAPMHRSWRHRW